MFLQRRETTVPAYYNAGVVVRAVFALGLQKSPAWFAVTTPPKRTTARTSG
jgi:hypothetical protein